MATFDYLCPECGTRIERFVRQDGGGRYKVTYGPGGRREVEDNRENPPPRKVRCKCGADALPVPTSTLLHMRADGTQQSGWTKPGWAGVDYSNGPDGGKATHLKNLDGSPLGG